MFPEQVSPARFRMSPPPPASFYRRVDETVSILTECNLLRNVCLRGFALRDWINTLTHQRAGSIGLVARRSEPYRMQRAERHLPPAARITVTENPVTPLTLRNQIEASAIAQFASLFGLGFLHR